MILAYIFINGVFDQNEIIAESIYRQKWKLLDLIIGHSNKLLNEENKHLLSTRFDFNIRIKVNKLKSFCVIASDFQSTN